MITIDIECICPRCHNTYRYIRECRTPKEAESKTRRASKNKDICLDCYKAEQQQKAEELAAILDLPELEGRTEKQIQFAFSLRSRYIESHLKLIQKAKCELNAIQPEAVAVEAQKYSMSEDEVVEAAFSQIDLLKEYLCLTETSARRLIDALR